MEDLSWMLGCFFWWGVYDGYGIVGETMVECGM